MDLDRWTDEDLMIARSGPNAGPSYAALYRRHERLILAYFMRRVRSPDLALDLTAETFAQTLASRPRFSDRGPGSAIRWIYGIAGNVLASSARQASHEQRKRDQLRIEMPVLTSAEQDDVTALASEDAVTTALAMLPAEQREAVRAFVLEDRPYSEIATALGEAESTVRKRVSRGLAALRHRTAGGR